MFDFAGKLFDASDFPPRWGCGRWSSFDGWFSIVAELGVFSAYMTLPAILRSIHRRRDGRLVYPHIFRLFEAFIFLCGLTHLASAFMFWMPYYRITALLVMATAVVSWATVVVLWRAVPSILQLRTPAEVEADYQARMALKRQLKATLHSAISAVLCADQDGRITYANPAAERMFGHAGDEWDNVAQIVPERYRMAHRRGMARFHATGESSIIGRVTEMTAVRRNGEEFPVSVSLTRWTGDDGRNCFAAFVADLTQARADAAEIAAKRRELEAELENRRLLERELAALRDLQKTQGQHIVTTLDAIDRLSNVADRLKDLMDERTK